VSLFRRAKRDNPPCETISPRGGAFHFALFLHFILQYSFGVEANTSIDCYVFCTAYFVLSEHIMLDVIFIASTIVFFVIALLYVKGCDSL